MKKTLLALSTLAASLAFSAQIGDSFLLQTKNTSMAFEKRGTTWRLLHYGNRIENFADAKPLLPDWGGGNGVCSPKQTTYAAQGADTHGNHNGNNFGGLSVIHADGALSTELEAAGAETIDDQAGTTHLVLTLKDPVYPFTVVQHFRAAEASDVIETWTEISHDEAKPVSLVRMDSAALFFPVQAKEFHTLTMTGQWGCEGQVVETPLARGQTVNMTSRSGVRSAFGNNAAFMVSVGEKATETSGNVIAGALAWSGSWHIDLRRDQVDGLYIQAGADNASGPYVLDPGKKLITPKLALTTTTFGKGQASRNFHRWARDLQLRDGHLLRPILLNSWEGAYFDFTEQTLTDMMDGVKEMGGEMFVLDDGWFGLGKYARNDDRRGLGDWVVNTEKLPHGLAWLSEQAKQRGLQFGFWVEPEMANTNSALAVEHPEWILREKTRALRTGRGGSQVVLDFTNPDVRDNIFNQLDALYSACPGLAYIKWDANRHFGNIGSAYLPATKQANIWFDYTTGLYELLARIQAKYPKLLLNACSSGGGHMDYGFLHFSDEFWTSDDTDARERVYIQWGASQFYPACAMGSHVTVVPNHQTRRTTPLKYRFDVAMSGRMGFELHPKNMAQEELEFAKECVANYKRIRPTVQQGDLYRLVSPWQNSLAALNFVDDEKANAVAFVYGLVRSPNTDLPAPLRLQGLDPDKLYTLREINLQKGAKPHVPCNGKTVSGRALMAVGIPFRLKGDYDSIAIELTAK